MTDLSTECSWDQLYIFDGNSFRNQTLGVYSGEFAPRPVYARSGQVGKGLINLLSLHGV